MIDVDCLIRPLVNTEIALFDDHFARHRAESGRGDYHFMPFSPQDLEGPQGLDVSSLSLGLDDLGWQRWWVAWTPTQDRIIGHVDLKGSHLKTCMHRCDLGVGIERAFRDQGLGRRLMATAIEFVTTAAPLAWLDLRVFAHNANARKLYQSLGFVERVTLVDQIRIDGESLDDVLMTLSVE